MYNFYIMTENIKIQILIDQIKDELRKKEKKRDVQIKKLKKIIYDYSHENGEYFTALYNVGRLKSIIHHMFEIIQKQDVRITELERK